MRTETVQYSGLVGHSGPAVRFDGIPGGQPTGKAAMVAGPGLSNLFIKEASYGRRDRAYRKDK